MRVLEGSDAQNNHRSRCPWCQRAMMGFQYCAADSGSGYKTPSSHWLMELPRIVRQSIRCCDSVMRRSGPMPLRACRRISPSRVSQAYLIERHVTGPDGTPLSDAAALGVTSLDATRAGPQAIAGLVRGQWAIESLHWLRHPLPRRPVTGPHPLRATGHGRPQEPRNRRAPSRRTARHHRSHPLGQPAHGQALHHPRTHIMILKRLWGQASLRPRLASWRRKTHHRRSG